MYLAFTAGGDGRWWEEGVVPERLVVVGGGARGNVGRFCRPAGGPRLDVVVLEAGGYAAYGMCGLPYYLSGVVAGAETLVAYRPEFFREERHIDLRLHVRATRLEAQRHVIHFRGDGREQRLTYNHLIVAAGGTPVVPPIPGLDDDHVFTVRTLESAISLRSLLDAGHVGRALVVGAGYIGLEMAEALVARGVSVTVVEALPRVMSTVDPPIATAVEEEVRRHGVDLRLNARLNEVRPYRSRPRAHVDGAVLHGRRGCDRRRRSARGECGR